MANELMKMTKETAMNSVLSRINKQKEEFGMSIPSGYNVANAINSAWLILQDVTAKVGNEYKPALEVCTQNSVVETLHNMVLQGLSPAKKQCYFIPYGKKLTLVTSYLGNVAATKRLKGVKNVFANVIYEGDDFQHTIDLETGLIKILKHDQSFENIDINKIKGAYAVIVKDDGNNFVEIMNINQIKSSWNQGAAKGKSGAHTNFADEMAKKTVINRACKRFWNTSDDSDLIIESLLNNQDEDEVDSVQNTHKAVREEIKERANAEVIDIRDFEEVKEDILDVEPSQIKQESILDAGF